jgi:hypothetical protein
MVRMTAQHRTRIAGKRVALGVLSGALLLATCGLCSPARPGAPDACAPPPASPSVVNVKDKGATGDGRTDDTAAIQAAIDVVGGTKGTVLVPKGTYMVDTTSRGRLKLKDDMTLKLADGATLKAIPNDSEKYALLTIFGVSNVWVIGGTLEGDRDQHKGKSGQWGFGIRIGKGAKHITIGGVTNKVVELEARFRARFAHGPRPDFAPPSPDRGDEPGAPAPNSTDDAPPPSQE